MSRRSPFLKALGASAPAAVVLLTVAVATSCTETVPVDMPDAPTGPARSARGKPPGGAQVPVTDDDPGLPVQTREGLLRGSAVPAGRRVAADVYRRLAGDLLARYPAALLEKAGLRRVVLCEDLSYDGTRCSAFTDVERGRIYLNVGAGLDPAYVTWTVHHEVFHQIDYAGDHQLDPDPAWESLNAPGFRYGVGGDAEHLQADPEAGNDAGAPGFLNRYATSSPAEDKAELYACMVVKPDLARHRAAGDDILRLKSARVREMVGALGPDGGLLAGR